MKIKILSSAVEDLYAGRVFYEKQTEGLGEYFFDSIFSDIDSLVLYAGIHQKVSDYYRLLSKRFPYAVYYKIDEQLVESCGELSTSGVIQTKYLEHLMAGEPRLEPDVKEIRKKILTCIRL